MYIIQQRDDPNKLERLRGGDELVSHRKQEVEEHDKDESKNGDKLQ